MFQTYQTFYLIKKVKKMRSGRRQSIKTIEIQPRRLSIQPRKRKRSSIIDIDTVGLLRSCVGLALSRISILNQVLISGIVKYVEICLRMR